MRSLGIVAMGLVLWQNVAPAQTNNIEAPPADNSTTDAKTGVIGGTAALRPEYTPLTASERWKLYFLSTFGPGAIARAAFVGGINQWSGTPKEWREGAEAYGERFGNAFAIHVIRNTLASGAAAALHEDNRYVRSTETGIWKRSRHVVTSVFIARNNAGAEHFAYSRFGGAISASFISRIWQPRSTNTSGDAAVNFGLSLLADMGWNAVKEFRPHRSPRQ
jgi:hypothetical protein